MLRSYQTSGGSTDEREDVSTTGSGCLIPTFTVIHHNTLIYNTNHRHYKIKHSCAVVCWIGPGGRCLETCLQTGPKTPMGLWDLWFGEQKVQ